MTGATAEDPTHRQGLILALVARQPDASDGLQHICARLFAARIGPLQPQDGPPDAQRRDVRPIPTATP